MARTQAADYDQRREAITAAAATLFAKNGFLGASVADISAACNMSKSLIYHYYPAKEDILFAVMWDHVSRLVDVANMISALKRPADELVKMFARCLMEVYVDAQAAQKILLNELDHLPPDKRALVVHAQREVIDALDRLVVELRPGMKHQPKQRRPVVMMFFGMLNWTHIWFDPKGAVPAAKIADLAAEMFLMGLPR